jgi:hypothetical protein
LVGVQAFFYLYGIMLFFIKLVLISREEDLTQQRIEEHRGGMYCARDD